MIADSLVDGHALVQLIWVGLAAGLVFVVAFAVAIFGAAHAVHERHERRVGAATLYTVLGGAAGLICIAAVVAGILVMAHKS